ncbi:MAG: hypothetical protein R3C61_20025 [Bacteroidia bacterium]
MKKLFALGTILIGCMLAFSQEPEPDLRMEVAVEGYSDKYYVAATGDLGLVLYHQSDTTDENKDPIWTFTKFTTDFIEIWKREAAVDKGLVYQREYFDGVAVHALFLPIKSRLKTRFQIISLNAETGDIYSTEGVIPYKVKVNDFSVVKNMAYIGGETEMGKLEQIGRGAAVTAVFPIFLGILQYNPKMVLMRSDIYQDKTLEEKFDYYKASSVESLSPNEYARSMSVVINHSPQRKKDKVYIKEYAQEKLIRNLEVNPKGANRLLTGRIKHINREEFLIIGTYAAPYFDQKLGKRFGTWLTHTKLEGEAQGIYIAKFSYRSQKFIQYYNFSEFENFFEAYGKKVAEKVKKKASKRKKKAEKRAKKKKATKELILEVSLLIHDIIETPEEYLLVAEAYYPVYQEMNSSFNPLSGETGYSRPGRGNVLLGYRYTHAITAGFDKFKGMMKWDNSFPIWNIMSDKLEQRVQVFHNEEDTTTTMIFNNEGLIQSRVVKGGEIIQSRKIKQVETEFMTDRIKEDYNSDIEYWYGNYFLAWGYEKIAKTDEKILSQERRRHVFYFYKVAY